MYDVAATPKAALPELVQMFRKEGAMEKLKANPRFKDYWTDAGFCKKIAEIRGEHGGDPQDFLKKYMFEPRMMQCIGVRSCYPAFFLFLFPYLFLAEVAKLRVETPPLVILNLGLPKRRLKFLGNPNIYIIRKRLGPYRSLPPTLDVACMQAKGMHARMHFRNVPLALRFKCDATPPANTNYDVAPPTMMPLHRL